MSLINEIRLGGHCAEAPIKIYSKLNHEIVKVAVYTHDWRKNEAGIIEEYKEIHRCLFFNTNAEKAIKFLQKGTHIFLVGPMHYQVRIKPNGVKAFYANVIVQEFTVADRIMVSKEMLTELFPDKNFNRVELARERLAREEFDREVLRMENHVRKFARSHS